MLRKFSLIGAVAAALFFPIPASADSALGGWKACPSGGVPVIEDTKLLPLISMDVCLFRSAS